jgi:hypothetical protein
MRPLDRIAGNVVYIFFSFLGHPGLLFLQAVLRIRDSGWVKNQDPGLTTRIKFFGVKYLNSLMRIQDPGWEKFVFGIRDKHPGSATLPASATDPWKSWEVSFLSLKRCRQC